MPDIRSERHVYAAAVCGARLRQRVELAAEQPESLLRWSLVEVKASERAVIPGPVRVAVGLPDQLVSAVEHADHTARKAQGARCGVVDTDRCQTHSCLFNH